MNKDLSLRAGQRTIERVMYVPLKLNIVRTYKQNVLLPYHASLTLERERDFAPVTETRGCASSAICKERNNDRNTVTYSLK